MATWEFKPRKPATAEPELNLLMPKGSEQSLWGSLVQTFKDTFFPKELPPLVLTSKPVPVKDIWGFYSYKKSGATLSTISHIIVLAAILLGTYYLGKKVTEEPKKEVVTLIAPNLDVQVMKPAKPESGGGGGGASRAKSKSPNRNIPT